MCRAWKGKGGRGGGPERGSLDSRDDLLNVDAYALGGGSLSTCFYEHLMRLRGGGGAEGLSLAICVMRSTQEGTGGGLMGNHCEGLTGKVKLLPPKRKKEKINKFGARRPHFHGDKLRRRSANEAALPWDGATNGRRSGRAGWPEDVAPPWTAHLGRDTTGQSGRVTVRVCQHVTVPACVSGNGRRRCRSTGGWWGGGSARRMLSRVRPVVTTAGSRLHPLLSKPIVFQYQGTLSAARQWICHFPGY